jgi:hypothetical protein
MRTTRQRAERAGLAIAELQRGYDLDEPSDLVRAIEDPDLPPRSRRAIEEALALR